MIGRSSLIIHRRSRQPDWWLGGPYWWICIHLSISKSISFKSQRRRIARAIASANKNTAKASVPLISIRPPAATGDHQKLDTKVKMLLWQFRQLCLFAFQMQRCFVRSIVDLARHRVFTQVSNRPTQYVNVVKYLSFPLFFFQSSHRYFALLCLFSGWKRWEDK